VEAAWAFHKDDGGNPIKGRRWSPDAYCSSGQPIRFRRATSRRTQIVPYAWPLGFRLALAGLFAGISLFHSAIRSGPRFHWISKHKPDRIYCWPVTPLIYALRHRKSRSSYCYPILPCISIQTVTGCWERKPPALHFAPHRIQRHPYNVYGLLVGAYGTRLGADAAFWIHRCECGQCDGRSTTRNPKRTLQKRPRVRWASRSMCRLPSTKASPSG